MDNLPGSSERSQGLEARKAELERRMVLGEDLIRTERDLGNMAKAEQYEQHWLKYLREYEEICDQLEKDRL